MAAQQALHPGENLQRYTSNDTCGQVIEVHWGLLNGEVWFLLFGEVSELLFWELYGLLIGEFWDC
jgi:hypothetical protein